MVYCLGNQILGVLPGVDACFGLRRETHGLHGHGVRVRRDVVRQDQDRRLAGAHEVVRHGVDEVGALGVNWLRVLYTAEPPQIEERVGHQLHAVVPTLMGLEAQQQALQFVLPCKGPFDALP
jgi:hypothetical protein